MAPLPTLTILDQTQVSPAATLGDKLLPLTYFDFMWLNQPPVHNLFFYDLPVTQTQFIQTVIPNLKNSLSITLQHFFPFSGNLFVYPTSSKKPEIRYVEGDSVTVTFAESNLDYNELTGNHPRNCEMFYPLTPLLGDVDKTSDFTKVPVFCVQVTLFPGSGISIGMTNHHCLGDASTRFCFVNAWATITRSGSDELFLADHGTLPFYDRVINNPKLDDHLVKGVEVENFEFRPRKLSGPTDVVRATFILPRTVLSRMKQFVLTQLPTIPYVSCFTVACAYMGSCVAKIRDDELQVYTMSINCRARLDPPIPATYIGNCLGFCMGIEQCKVLKEEDGFVIAAKLIGESLHARLTDKEGIVKQEKRTEFPSGVPMTVVGVAGSPKLKFYELDFGWGKAKKLEIVSSNNGLSMSINGCKGKNEDLEIGINLPSVEMEKFVRIFHEGLEPYV